MPDSRKVHEIPVPRLGGISFFPVILIVLCFILGVRFYCGYPIENLPTNVFLFFAVGGMMLFLIGVADDLVGVGYRYKFLVQISSPSTMQISPNTKSEILLNPEANPSMPSIRLMALVIYTTTNKVNNTPKIFGNS